MQWSMSIDLQWVFFQQHFYNINAYSSIDHYTLNRYPRCAIQPCGRASALVSLGPQVDLQVPSASRREGEQGGEKEYDNTNAHAGEECRTCNEYLCILLILIFFCLLSLSSSSSLPLDFPLSSTETREARAEEEETEILAEYTGYIRGTGISILRFRGDDPLCSMLPILVSSVHLSLVPYAV